MSIGQDVLRLRKEKGYTQDDLANILGVSRSAVSTWENDDHAPSGVVMKQLDRLFRGETPVAYRVRQTNARPNVAREPLPDQDVSEVGRAVAIEHVDEDGRVIMRISYVVEAGRPVRIGVRRRDQIDG